jgi:hypothetical protein
VPWSTSSSAPCAPSNSSDSPRARALDRCGDVADHRRDRLALRERLVARLREVDRRRVVVMHEHEVVQLEERLELLGEARRLEQVLHAKRAPRDLVLVGGADPASRRADLQGVAEPRFASLVERDVDRQHQRAGRRKGEPRAHVDARLLEFADLLHERGGRHYDAVADQDRDAVAQHARRNQAQDRLAPADDERVTRVVPALEAHDTLRAFGQPVDDLALAFVAPLRADDDDVLGHVSGVGPPEPDDRPPRGAASGASVGVVASQVGFSRLASCRRSSVKPVAGRARPNALPMPS